MELELDFTPPGAAVGSKKYHPHPMCCVAWELERRDVKADHRPRGSDVPAEVVNALASLALLV